MTALLMPAGSGRWRRGMSGSAVQQRVHGGGHACTRQGGRGKDARAQSEENVRVYRIKYNNGAATSTDVLEAITLQTKAETNYYSADYELNRAYAKLMYSIGNDLTAIYKKMEK